MSQLAGQVALVTGGTRGIGAAIDPAADVDGFDRQFAVNVKGVATAVRTASQLFPMDVESSTLARSSGVVRHSLVSLTTQQARRQSRPTPGWARDLCSRSIAVNVVLPGPINTGMNPDISAFAPMLTQMTALGRFGRTDEGASAVAFLAGPDASYITGATLEVDGGMLA